MANGKICPKLLYSGAVEACEVVTQRLRCINRQLKDDPPQSDTLTPAIREKVSTALDQHMRRCENTSYIVN